MIVGPKMPTESALTLDRHQGFGDNDSQPDDIIRFNQRQNSARRILALSWERISLGGAVMDLNELEMKVTGTIFNESNLAETALWFESVIKKCDPDLVLVSTKMDVSMNDIHLN